MTSLIRVCVLALILHISSYVNAQNTIPVNYLNTPAQLSFNNTPFNLAWTSHPTAQYYKQEYLPKGESPEKFSNMLLLEVLSSQMQLKDAVASKVAELNSMKQSNPYVSYESFYNKEKDEYVLDFVVTANAPDGKQISIAERNVYRYKKYQGAGGVTGVLLFGVSKRSYGSDAAKFVAGLTTTTRQDLVNKVKAYVFPSIKLK